MRTPLDSSPKAITFFLGQMNWIMFTMSTMSRDWTQNLRLLRFLHSIDLADEVPDDEPAPHTVLARRCCPLHDGADNPQAFLVYGDGYVCLTHQCHKIREFGPNLFGLVRHLVYRATKRVVGFLEAIQYAERHKDQLAALIPEGVRYQSRNKPFRPPVSYTREDLASCLNIPAPYYLSRGYQPETLKTFGVGTCVRQLPDGKNLLGWSIIPVLDGPTGGTPHVVGYTARNPRWKEGDRYPRWLHAFNRTDHVFNQPNAVLWTSPLIICEGPGDAMRFYEAGYKRAVATFGASLSGGQFGCLMGPLDISKKVYIAPDSDSAGQEFAESVMSKLRHFSCRRPEVIYPPTDFKDFGEMSVEAIRAVVRQHP